MTSMQEQALAKCAEEPIHQIGSVQPHGVLMVLSADQQRVVLQVSENLADLIDVPASDARNKPLSEAVGKLAVMQIEQLITVAGADKPATGLVSFTLKGDVAELQAHLYLSDGMVVLELVRDDEVAQEECLALLLSDLNRRQLKSRADPDIFSYFEQIATLVRTLTGYDSVMAYRFDATGDGEVIAQSRVETAPSYLGLRFPASDIPPQARRLYSVNMVRQVADINATSIPLLPILNPATGEPLDMTLSALRSLSPIHIEYLRNMGVQASMSISILLNGCLWGLIVCHHRTEKRVSIGVREAAVFISRLVSEQISSIESLAVHKQIEKVAHIVAGLKRDFLQVKQADLQRRLRDMQHLFDATGLIAVVDGKCHVHGEVPAMPLTETLLAWLAEQAFEQGVFSSDHLSESFPAASACTDSAAGLLAIRISADMRCGFVWLRKEKLRTVQWAGKSDKDITPDGAGSYRLRPRKSFQIWSELWRGYSFSWSLFDTEIAAMLVRRLLVPDMVAMMK